jgi:hypothetical protein
MKKKKKLRRCTCIVAAEFRALRQQAARWQESMARLVLALLALTAVNAQAPLVTTAKAAALIGHGHLKNGNLGLLPSFGDFASSEAYYLRAYELFTQNKGAGHFLTKARHAPSRRQAPQAQRQQGSCY